MKPAGVARAPPPPPPRSVWPRPALPPPNPHWILATGMTVVRSRPTGSPYTCFAFRVELDDVADALGKGRFAGHGCLRTVASCQLPVAGCRLPVASCRLPVASCRLPVAEGNVMQNQ